MKNKLFFLCLLLLVIAFSSHGQALLPDNIIDAGCYGKPDSTAWDIQRTFMTGNEVQTYGQPYVGDVDGDGRSEIVI